MIKIIKNREYLISALQWCIENIDGKWETKSEKIGDCLRSFKDNDWKDFISRNILSLNANHSAPMSGTFVFENKEDAMKFKLVWG